MDSTTISVPEELRKWLKKKAAEEDTTQIALIRKALGKTYGYGKTPVHKKVRT